MSRICQLSGKKPMVGNNVSHSNKKTKRRFDINLIKKKIEKLSDQDDFIIFFKNLFASNNPSKEIP